MVGGPFLQLARRHQNVSILVMSAMRRQFKGPILQHTDKQRRNRVDSGLPREPFAFY